MTGNNKGFFIVVEGIEGAGKSSCIRLIDEILAEHYTGEIVHTREPGGTRLAERIRNILLTRDEESLCTEAELLLMYASRAQLVNQVILPALAAGKVVVGDRHDLSSRAYQGGGRGMDLNMIRRIKTLAIGDFRPDLTILLDVDPLTGMKRVDSRGQERDRFESEKLSFFERVRHQYLVEAQEEPSIKVIDACQSEELVHQDIRQVVEEFLCSRG